MTTVDKTTEAQRFRDAMASFPSGVTLVTTVDSGGRWRGFTATSFCSVSLEPPLVLVCLATTAECHQAFTSAEHWVVHVLGAEHTETALRFATRGADKFAGSDFSADERGVPVLDRAIVTLTCTAHAVHPGGDHTILVARVERTQVRDDTPAVYFRRRFHGLQPA